MSLPQCGVTVSWGTCSLGMPEQPAPPTFSSPGLLTLSLAILLAFVHISVDWSLQNDDNMEEMSCHLHYFEILFWMLTPVTFKLFPGIFSSFPGFSGFTQSVALSFLKITDPLVFLTVVCPSSARLVFWKWGIWDSFACRILDWETQTYKNFQLIIFRHTLMSELDQSKSND